MIVMQVRALTASPDVRKQIEHADQTWHMTWGQLLINYGDAVAHYHQIGWQELRSLPANKKIGPAAIQIVERMKTHLANIGLH